MSKDLLNTVWIKTPLGNKILNIIDKETKKTFHISYQDFESVSKEKLLLPDELPDELLETLLATITPETAIATDKGEYFILKGDFRKQYEKCSTLKECMKIYNDNE